MTEPKNPQPQHQPPAQGPKEPQPRPGQGQGQHPHNIEDDGPQPGQENPQVKQNAAAMANGLMALDETIRTQLKLAGPPGSGLFMLLDNLAHSTLGTKRSAFPQALDVHYGRQQAPAPGVPGASPPGPLPGAGRGQSPHANSSAPLGPNN